MNRIYSFLVLFLLSFSSMAQTGTGEARFSLKEAVDYAVKNNLDVKNTDVDRRVALARKGQVRAAGLPQINGNVDFTHNINIQRTVLEYGASPLFQPDATHPKGTPTSIAFGLHNQSTPNITASQVLFDPAFFSSVHAARIYQDLSSKNVTRSKIETAHNVTKAYYAVLVNQKQLAYLEVNLARLDSSYLETRARLQNGLARQIELDRIEVSYNNLKEEKARVERVVQLSKALLKFQMNLPSDTTVTLTDDLNSDVLTTIVQMPGEGSKKYYGDRIEYRISQTQLALSKIDTRVARGSRYPKLSAFAAYGYTTAATDPAQIFKFQKDRWFNYSYIGVRLQVPIFNGFSAYYRVQEKKLEEERAQNNLRHLEHNIDIQVEESIINFNNSIESLRIQKRNLDLAEKNLQVLKAEFEQGISMSLDVTVAEAALKEAQTNYYNSVYNALLSKSDYDRATGVLFKE
ncbi:MAG TPA: TolC family protein [Cytophagaceae bacterium]|nr:TolC family protein [Cytophagaceae bacterium]